MPKVCKDKEARATPYETHARKRAKSADHESADLESEEEEHDFHAYFTSRGADAITAAMTAAMVGQGFVVIHVLAADEGPMWTARVSTLESICANADSNHLELTFLHNEDFPVYSREVHWTMALTRTITTQDCQYYIYTVPPCMEALVPRITTQPPPEFVETLKLFHYQMICSFSNYATLLDALVVGSTYFVVQHVPIEALKGRSAVLELLLKNKKKEGVEPGWVAYKAEFLGFDTCLGDALPLLRFQYQKRFADDEHPTYFFSTDEVELADELELSPPQTRVGPTMRCLLFSCA